MKNLFDPGTVGEVKTRLAKLRPDSERQWGSMAPAQAMAHCTGSFELAMGERQHPRAFIGRFIGWIIKPLVLGNETPLRRNAPTVKGLLVKDKRNWATEREHLYQMIDRFAAAGPPGCTTHPHSFFGRLTPDEWALLMYKHLDHHLRQFGA